MSFRFAFQKYLDNPQLYNEIVFYDENVIILKDLFPKSLRHYLIIPRDAEISRQHPLTLFNRDYENFTACQLYDLLQTYISKTKQLIIDDIQSIIPQNEDNKLLLKSLPQFINVGFHAVPSLSNLHIHVITRDFHSPRLKHKKHYNSFNTPFFIDFDTINPMPQERDSQLTEYSDDDSSDQDNSTKGYKNVEVDSKHYENIIKTSPLVCSYCGKNFGNKFQNLKAHLENEFTKKFSQFGVELSKLVPNNVET